MKNFSLFIFTFLSGVILTFIGVFFYQKNGEIDILSPLVEKQQSQKDKNLEKYSYENLKNTYFSPKEITLGKKVKDDEQFSSRIFYYQDQEDKVSGLINIPKAQSESLPVIIMFRGYVDRNIYTTGEGTRRTGEAISKAGFITLAPDFLGYGESSSPSADPIEERFQTYTTALSLLSSVQNLNNALRKENLPLADTEKIGIWGHSNGGHIALAVLEITEKSYPTVLWAPVSKPFPYSILYFTDDFDDYGKALRKLVADFEATYSADKYSVTTYFDSINAPIEIHQGTLDEAVPLEWSNELNTILRSLGKDITYFTYPGENHNFLNGNWPLALSRSILFYQKKF